MEVRRGEIKYLCCEQVGSVAMVQLKSSCHTSWIQGFLKYQYNMQWFPPTINLNLQYVEFAGFIFSKCSVMFSPWWRSPPPEPEASGITT